MKNPPPWSSVHSQAWPISATAVQTSLGQPGIRTPVQPAAMAGKTPSSAPFGSSSPAPNTQAAFDAAAARRDERWDRFGQVVDTGLGVVREVTGSNRTRSAETNIILGGSSEPAPIPWIPIGIGVAALAALVLMKDSK